MFTHRFRFMANAAGSHAITPTNILGACGVIGQVTNTSVAAFASSFRIRAVRVWGFAASASLVRLIWAGAANSPDIVRSDSATNVNRSPFCGGPPPRQSLASFWQVAGNGTLFSVVCPVNSIVDIVLDAILGDTLTATSIATATDVVGTLYYLALDGPAANVLRPVGLPTTS